MSTIELSRYKKFYIWFGKKMSLLGVKRNNSPGYLATESGILTMFADGVVLILAGSYFINPSLITLFLSLAFGSFIIKRVFPSIIQLISSVNLIRVGK